jgi:peptidoglycan/xylan/chitin deacetylase (PgdA/CDA1 family)
MGATGILSLLERITGLRRSILVVLTYHRIAVPGINSNLYYDQVISATPSSFKTQIEFLARYFHILRLDEACDLVNGVGALRIARRPAVLVTFDDGYRDNVEIALPILRRFGVPATFFIPTGLIEVPKLPWWDHVAFVIKQTSVTHFRLERCPGDVSPIVIDLGIEPTAAKRTAAIMQVIRLFLDGAITDQEWFLAQLDQRSAVSVDNASQASQLFMNWEQVKQLVDQGMSVGSHGHSHRALAELEDDAQSQELEISRRMLESKLGHTVHAVAYPFGWASTFTTRTMEYAAKAGYRLAFSSLEGVNYPGTSSIEPFALRRINVGAGDCAFLLRARVVLHAIFGRSWL